MRISRPFDRVELAAYKRVVKEGLKRSVVSFYPIKSWCSTNLLFVKDIYSVLLLILFHRGKYFTKPKLV